MGEMYMAFVQAETRFLDIPYQMKVELVAP